MQKSGGGRTWEIAVPNGSYNVFVVAGDADHFDSVFRINVEGVLTVSGTPTTSARWVSGTRTVTVTDGRLTISSGSGASNNKICFVDIAAAGAAAAPPKTVPVETPLRLEWITSDAKGRVTLGISKPVGATLRIEASSDLESWERISGIVDVNGTVSFDDPASSTERARFYRALIE